MIDLLTLRDHEPPMGDFAVRPTLASTKAVWARRLPGEEAAPDHRIMHSRVLQLHGPARLQKVGLRRTPGYHKCGSRMDLDWVRSFRVLAWNDAAWKVVRHEADVSAPAEDSAIWFDLADVTTSAVVLEVRRSGIDDWWPGWNLASGAFLLKAEESPALAPRLERALETGRVSLDGLPHGIDAYCDNGEVRYRSKYLEVGFALNRAGFSFLSIDDEGEGRTGLSVLRNQPGSFFQGIFHSPMGSPPDAAFSLRYKVEGRVAVEGNVVEYDVRLAGGQRYELRWTVGERELLLEATRVAERDERTWKSCAWNVALDSRVTPAHVIGSIARTGETGLLEPSAWLHFPGYGSLCVEAEEGDVMLRSDAYRHVDMTILEVKLGERPQPEGDYVLSAGRHAAAIRFTVSQPEIALVDEAPRAVGRAVRRCALTSMTYRPDTATLSNNGISIHCPISLDNWSALATRIGPILPRTDALDLLRDSLERWLDGGPGYTSGPLLQDGRYHEAEDEYIMTAAAGLLALAEFLEAAGSTDWIARYRQPIRRRLDRTRSYDVDGDGIIESTYRTGTSGSGQWSTCWLDVVSFGWKDAFTNALLYPALVRLSDVLPALDAVDLADGLADWAVKLKDSYAPTFLNPDTGRIAGWRCQEDRLHDHAFPMVSGAAVAGGLLDAELARSVLENILAEMKHQGVPHARFGLPVSLRHIPDADLADIMQGYPKGYYQNAGITHAQTRHFVAGLYAAGFDEEADRLLEELCEGMSEGIVFGGSKSGVDWRRWDGAPCGYEGLLTDQFGILAVALERYGARTSAVEEASAAPGHKLDVESEGPAP